MCAAAADADDDDDDSVCGSGETAPPSTRRRMLSAIFWAVVGAAMANEAGVPACRAGVAKVATCGVRVGNICCFFSGGGCQRSFSSLCIDEYGVVVGFAAVAVVASNVNLAAMALAANEGRASNGMTNGVDEDTFDDGGDDRDAGADGDSDDDDDDNEEEGESFAFRSGANEWCNAASARTLCDSNTRESADVGDAKSAVANARSLPSSTLSALSRMWLSMLILRVDWMRASPEELVSTVLPVELPKSAS